MPSICFSETGIESLSEKIAEDMPTLFGPRLYGERGCRLRILLKHEEQLKVEAPKPKLALGTRKDQEDFWEAFLGKKIGKQYKGAVEESSNSLGKYLPEDSQLDVVEIIRDTEEQ